MDGTGAPARLVTVVIRGTKIEAVAPDAPVPAGARVIDAAGQTLMPGLFDLHTHLSASAVTGLAGDWGKSLKAYLACGVTTVNDYATNGEMFAPLRQLLSSGAVAGAARQHGDPHEHARRTRHGGRVGRLHDAHRVHARGGACEDQNGALLQARCDQGLHRWLALWHGAQSEQHEPGDALGDRAGCACGGSEGLHAHGDAGGARKSPPARVWTCWCTASAMRTWTRS